MIAKDEKFLHAENEVLHRYWFANFFDLNYMYTLRKHAYSNILKISPPKTESFHVEILIFFILLSRNKKDYVYPCKPQFYYIKMGFKGQGVMCGGGGGGGGAKLYRYVFVMDVFLLLSYLP